MAGNIRKKDKVTKYYDNDFDDFEFNEIDISEVLGPKENKEEVRKETKVKNDKEKQPDAKPVTVENFLEEKGGLIDFKVKEEIKEKPKKERSNEEENILNFVPKDLLELEQQEEAIQVDTKKTKRGRKKKIEAEETTKKARRKRLYNIDTNDKEVKMEIDEDQNAMILVLKNKNCRVDIIPEEYDVYTNNSKSYIIARQANLNLIFKDAFINIEKNNNSYIIETDQDVKLDYIACDIIKKENKILFTVENLSEVKFDENGLKLIIDETKVAENRVEDNNTLIISEEDGKVFLPYKKGEILQEIKKTKNTNIDEIINSNYVKPIETYKSSIKARFKEAYKLMREREGGSKGKAFMLGLELMFEFHLHPAIISACRNLEELDIYLDCLEDNELEKFTCFKIIYKAMPVIKKKVKV